MHSRAVCFRLVLRVFICVFCFILGCSVTISFTNTESCPLKKSHDGAVVTPLPKHIKPTSLVVLIISAPDNLPKRHALRRTWVTLIDPSAAKYFFVIGTKTIAREMEERLLTEHEHYSDLLMLPDVEEGYNLLSKKVLQSFVWVFQNQNPRFVLKVDDDSFVDIRRLLGELSSKSAQTHLYWGYFNGRAQIQHRGKWEETEWNLCDRYLPYARGGGYIISIGVIRFLAQNSAMFSIYKNEDVSVGAWLAPLNITRIHDVRFDTEWQSRGCSNQLLITHPHSEDDMDVLFKSLMTTGRLCSHEFHRRIPYLYDWNVPPSQCCSNPAPVDI